MYLVEKKSHGALRTTRNLNKCSKDSFYNQLPTDKCIVYHTFISNILLKL